MGKKQSQSGRATKNGETERHRWVVGRDEERGRIIGREEEAKRESKRRGGGGERMRWGVGTDRQREREKDTHTYTEHVRDQKQRGGRQRGMAVSACPWLPSFCRALPWGSGRAWVQVGQAATGPCPS